MSYESNKKQRPDGKNPLDLLVDARMDLTDLKYWVNEGADPKMIIEAIDFIRETLRLYQLSVYPPNPEDGE